MAVDGADDRMVTGGRTARTGRTRSSGSADSGGWAEPEKERRDWKKLFLVIGLAVLSWVATYVGMLELIEANMGELPLVHKIIIGFSVAMLMTMVVWLLDQMFAPIGLFSRAIYAAGYLFLTIISVGFGFGFYWKVLESRSEASRSAEGAVGQVQGSLLAASTRLEQLQNTLVTLTGISTTKAAQETATGTSCPNSRPGEGPRRKLREDDAARFTFASEFVKGRVGQVKGEMGALDADFAKISGNDKSIVDAQSGTRNEFMKGLSRRLDNTVTGFNAFRSDPQLKQIRQDLAERADRTTFPDTKGGSFQCPDQQLAGAIKGVVRAIDELPVLEKPKIAAVEGSEATIEAFRRLTATFAGLMTFKLPPSADELRDLQKKAVQSVESPAAARATVGDVQPGLSKRDYVPLAIAVFVDICLLLVSMGRPMNRMQGLVPKMQAAEKGPVYQILSKFTDIHKDAETREKFELFRHVVFDFNGDYYVAVPLIAPYRQKPGGPKGYSTADIEALQLDAHMLGNLFASFEKEKIFTRVYNPLLSTKKIQDKLWRQGSKFAHAGAFRVYRFKDGAWSDIILGAVMGAAKRVDSERRRREEDGEDAVYPELPTQPNRGGTDVRSDDGLQLPGLPTSATAAGRDAPLQGPLDADHNAQFGRYASFADPVPAAPAARPLARIIEKARQPRLADFEADVSVTRPANNNTVPAAPAATVTQLKPTATRATGGIPSLRTLTDRGDRFAVRGAFESADRAGVRAALHEAPERFLAAAAMAPHVAPVDAPRMQETVFAPAAPEPVVAPVAEILPRMPSGSVAGEPRINVTLVERRATYSVPSSEHSVTAPGLPHAGQIEMFAAPADAPRTLDDGATVKRLSDALKAMSTPEWTAEQSHALGGHEPVDAGDEGLDAASDSRLAIDDMTRVAERFRPSPVVAARGRE